MYPGHLSFVASPFMASRTRLDPLATLVNVATQAINGRATNGDDDLILL